MNIYICVCVCVLRVCVLDYSSMFRLLSYNHLQGAAPTHKNICGVKNLNTCIFFVYHCCLKLAVVKEPKRARVVSCVQGDSGGICNTLGNDSMCDSKQKSSYEHGSDFERLPRYGKKKIRTILRARTAIT